ncbi:MAG: hypothetical protein L0Y58_19985 [Verrucomicrobia subdivision 3 bacterium]|nr:hypothetical protein [Limisphaerales bacterium]
MMAFAFGAQMFVTALGPGTVANGAAGNTERIDGWAEILRQPGDPDHGVKPSLYIHERTAARPNATRTNPPGDLWNAALTVFQSHATVRVALTIQHSLFTLALQTASNLLVS